MKKNSKPKYKSIASGIQSRYRKEKLRLGLCVVSGCQSKLNSDNYCTECLIKRRDWEKTRSVKRSEDGMCYKCTINPAETYLMICIECWFKQKAGANTGSQKNAPALKELWNKQDGKCAISGRTLVIGLNVSLDHIVPKSKGGSNKVANLQWTLTSVNSGKLGETSEEYIELCRDIVSFNKSKL